MAGPTRVYLKTKISIFSRFLWFHNNRPNEMLMGIYGLKSKQPVLTKMFPEMRLSESELSGVDFLWHEAKDIGKKVDHITCHADGCFHVKTKGEEQLYIQSVQRTEPLGPDTGPFLEFQVVGELAGRYIVTRSPKPPYVYLEVDPDKSISVRGIFSGANYPLEQHAAALVASVSQRQTVVQPMVRVISNTLKGILIPSMPRTIPPESMRTKPDGTFISFRFPKGDEHWIKAFFFA